MLVVDLSEFNDSTDYAALAKVCSGVIIRAGYRGYGSGTIVQDAKVLQHIAGVKRYNIPWTLYFMSQAVTKTEADQEANYCLTFAANKDFPIFFDCEFSGCPGNNGRADGLSRAQRTEIVNAFCATVKSHGFSAGVYVNEDWANNRINCPEIVSSGNKIWVAKYSSREPVIGVSVEGWQFSDKYQIGHGYYDASYWYKPIQGAATENKTTATPAATNTATNVSFKQTHGTKGLDSASGFSKGSAGVYQVYPSVGAHIRAGAGTNKKSLAILPKGTLVKCYGYYTMVGSTKWYFVVSDNGWTGYMSATVIQGTSL